MLIWSIVVRINNPWHERPTSVISGFAAAISGVQGGVRTLSASAHNIANAHTENFKRTQATLDESSVGGVSVNLTQDHRPGPLLPTGDDPFSFREGSNVELEEEFIHTLESTSLIEANLASIKTQNKVLGSLLDIIE